MSKFDKFLKESNEIPSIEWGSTLYHGTSMASAKKIFNSRSFANNDTGGVDEIGRGVYTHPSLNRTSPWVHLSSKGKAGAVLKLEFNRQLKLAIFKRGQNQRALIDSGFDGTYDKNGETQVPHQVLLFSAKPIGSNFPDLNKDLINWSNSEVIPFDSEKHDYLSGMDNAEEYKWYH